jgi:hypothetical protein
MIEFILGTAFGSLVSLLGVVFGAGIVKMREENNGE